MRPSHPQTLPAGPTVPSSRVKPWPPVPLCSGKSACSQRGALCRSKDPREPASQPRQGVCASHDVVRGPGLRTGSLAIGFSSGVSQAEAVFPWASWVSRWSAGPQPAACPPHCRGEASRLWCQRARHPAGQAVSLWLKYFMVGPMS